LKLKSFIPLYDLQVGGYLHSGRNSLSKEELKEAFISYISVDFNDEDDETHYRKLSIEELTEMWEFEIHKTDEPIEESYSY
jgi:hypothetical protein